MIYTICPRCTGTWVRARLLPLGDYPGTNAKCECADPLLHTGFLCELDCPGPPDYCGQGRCLHTLEGRVYDVTTETERLQNAPFCRCDVGWVGAVCDKACPGEPNHTTSYGPYLCLGRGECVLGGAARGARLLRALTRPPPPFFSFARAP